MTNEEAARRGRLNSMKCTGSVSVTYIEESVSYVNGVRQVVMQHSALPTVTVPRMISPNSRSPMILSLRTAQR